MKGTAKRSWMFSTTGAPGVSSMMRGMRTWLHRHVMAGTLLEGPSNDSQDTRSCVRLRLGVASVVDLGRSGLWQASRSQRYTRTSAPGFHLVSLATNFSGAVVRHVPNDWLGCNMQACAAETYGTASASPMHPTSGVGEAYGWFWPASPPPLQVSATFITISRMICVMVPRLLQPSQRETARRKEHSGTLTR